jgi:imidazolonepropionase-like amidohydrolase
MWLADCRVLDIHSGELRSGCVEVAGGHIGRVEDGDPPTGAETIELGGKTLAPGLISCHTHLSVVYPFSATDENEPQALTALRALARARDALRAGVTTIRCLLEIHRVELFLRRAAADGWAEVPRILGAGKAISTTGGHGAGHGCALADGGDGFLHAARSELAAGADHIKVFITGGIADASEGFDVPQMTDDEMRGAVRAAREHHTYVVAHAGSSGAIRQAIDAGILAFEHGYSLDDETAALLKEADASLTPTLCVTRLPEWMRDHHFTEEQIDKAMETGPEHLESIKRAVRAGVTLINGTDYPPGEPCDGTVCAVRELEFMVDAGLSPLEALQASTINAARLCRIDGETGAVEPGLAADLVAFDGDPTADASAARGISFVMSGGRVVRWDR